MSGGGNLQTASWPMSEDMLRAQEFQPCTILRRVRVGLTQGNAPTFEWLRVARIGATIARTTGRLQMTYAGQTSPTTHFLSTRWRRAKDPAGSGEIGLVVRPRDIVVDRDGNAYYVHTVNNAGGARVWLECEIRLGELNSLKNFSAQG